MAKKAEHNRTFNISVVGLSGTEKEKGDVGVGKSCLCNRFVRPLADDFYTDHISMLSQSDFGGCVVNNDHFLYWGEVTKMADDGSDLTFNVIEQTEFIDDSSFQPFKGGKTDPYYKRCAATKVTSAEKLMYICKNQLGLEHDFDRVLMPDGKLTVDGFVCVFDVSDVKQRPIERQVEYVALILNSLMKTKKPVVLATTKNDEVRSHNSKEAEALVARKEYKGSIPVIETSAHQNVNVELAFTTVAHMIDKTRARPKHVPFREAAKARKELLDVAKSAYLNLLRSQVLDYKAFWGNASKKFQDNPDFIRFLEFFGSDSAKTIFRRHTRQLKEHLIRKREDTFLKQIPNLLKEFLPDLTTIGDRQWGSCRNLIKQHGNFNDHFVMLDQDLSWSDTEYLDSTDERVPFTLLSFPEAETSFRNHVNTLQAESRRQELRKQFKHILEDNPHVTPGKTLQEVSIFFLGRESYDSLSEADRKEVYDRHQQEIREDAKKDFVELLYERAEVFAKYDPNETITTEDLQSIIQELKEEQRYKALGKLEEVRKVMLLNHLGFIQWPSKDRCPFRDHCMENSIEATLKRHRTKSGSTSSSQFFPDLDDNRLNLVLLGREGLADELANDIRLQCIDDEFAYEGCVFSLDYRPIDGDVSLPQNAFSTADFRPHGCFCVYSSSETLDYIKVSLEKTLLLDLESEERLPFQGLPLVIVLAYDPGHTEKGLMLLREEGQELAQSLRCPFIDIPEDMINEEMCKYKFHPVQINQALNKLMDCVRDRPGLGNPYSIVECAEPDIRVVLCMMCGDQYNVELPLGPFLGHQNCVVTADKEKYQLVTIETYVGDSCKRKVEVTVTSYHGASLLKDEFVHGFILVYSAKRKASLSTLKAFTDGIPNVPIQILAVTEGGGANAFFSNDSSQNIITEGNAIADKVKAHFMVTSLNFPQQTAVFSPFLKDVWDRKSDIEASYVFSGDESYNTVRSEPSESERLVDLDRRPPATLPKPWRNDSYSAPNGSNSTEDSEPIYDQPAAGQQSDSEQERASSTSPPYYDKAGDKVYDKTYDKAYDKTYDSAYGNNISPYGTTETGPYSEVNAEPLVKPSQLKGRKNQYAEHRKSCPVANIFVTKSEDENLQAIASDVPKLEHSSTVDQIDLKASDPERQPRYQFRKSKSMRLALKEDVEGWAVNSLYESADGRKLQKASTLPDARRQRGDEEDWENSQPEAPQYDYAGVRLTKWALRPKPATKPKPLDLNRYQSVTDRLSKNMSQKRPKRDSVQMDGNNIQAPLATPENIEIADYAQVLDAVSPEHPEHDNDYALVQDALPPGKFHRIRSTVKKQQQDNKAGTESDSECSSLERPKQDIYTRVHRKPTPHKKKHRQQRKSDPSYDKAPLIPAYTPDRLKPPDEYRKSVQHSASEGSEGTGDELQNGKKQRKRRSLKIKKKKAGNDLVPLLASSPPTEDVWLRNDSVADENPYEDVKPDSKLPFSGDEPCREELGDSGRWKPFNLKVLRRQDDPEKMRRKEEKKALDEEKRRKKEEERKKSKSVGRSFRRSKKKPKNAPGSEITTKMSLDDYVQKEQRLIPVFVEKCIMQIEEEGLTAEGIYRVPGNRAHVDLLLEKFKEDPNIDLNALDIPVNAVATALKGFFSDLHDPLIPSKLYDELIHAAGIQDKTGRLLALRGVLKKLPAVNHEVLKYLATHMHKVTKQSDVNSMDSKNLAICWWPTLLRPEFASFADMASNVMSLQDIVQTIIDQHGFFFYGENEV
ncbi:rho GTPase-activating protein 190 isoform X1 [Lingula anatina]|uniref:Rho GTPase-activating protein 190 isoform X1 n=1 Tax=Lingula anatina TaxID=7574 RepID=A0A1S3HQK5_LINAN|nr:rho GTPase-activating protein 190 isoform X1 [Lingula anatina]XP_013387312.1 rho GTPase-activating protein 190 isoform X1 [Lingula anatina]XP_013387313.1 rho GTPase-activating protein 190 isoform X1 [Lingula anatina]XP_013387314.1 rho GTPase-activating protein 190 isoform X1 [Lingula anatina]XP_013387315.1 rho GTPase-activating protein 190 isoform X1 [Lingula anatina]XP_013387316.1 rho GTPase-activating protein 190 isoform X1 [Lingula anatina]XP_013387317.1 rho GTPase-activating protein 19|eukprot:XP_013387311.1 rho GTPase-activating protein 190 isoform X1 [Lingula anatina]